MGDEQTKKTGSKSEKKVQVLEGDLTLQNSAAIKELFFKAISGSNKSIVFTFKDAGDVDLSFVQILCAAHRTAHEKGKHIEFVDGWPESFSNLINDAGLNEHVGCASDCSIECPWLNK